MKNIPELAYSDRKILTLCEYWARNAEFPTIDIRETPETSPCPIIVRVNNFGNGNEKVITSRLRNIEGKSIFQTCFIPRFNARNSEYPFSFMKTPVNRTYDQSAVFNRIRFGEQRSADKFLACIKDIPGSIPSDTEAFQVGSITDISEGKNFRGLYYRIATWLDSFPNIHYGLIHNEGGEVDDFPFDAFASFKMETEKSDLVFGINEGFAITSNYQWMGISLWAAPGARWGTEIVSNRGLISALARYSNYKILASLYGGLVQNYISFINDGTKGWISFWALFDDVDEYRGASTPFYTFKFRDDYATAGIDVNVSFVAFGPYANIDITKPNRITFRWDFTDQNNPVATMQMNEAQPKDILYNGGVTWTPLVSKAFNYLIFNGATNVYGVYPTVRVFGICQSGDYIPFVHPGSNRSFNTMQFSINNASEAEKNTVPITVAPTNFLQMFGPFRSSTLLNFYTQYIQFEPLAIDLKHRSLKLCYPDNNDMHLVCGFTAIGTYGASILSRNTELGFRSADGNWEMGIWLRNSGTTVESTSGYPESIMRFAGISQPAKINTHWRNTYSYNQTIWPSLMRHFAFNIQEHPKYSGEWIENCWRERYAFAWADDTIKASGSIRLDFEILRAKLTYDSGISSNVPWDAGNIHMSSLIHPFVEPDNSAFYWKDPIAMPEIFQKSPRRMRKTIPAFLIALGQPNDDFTIYPSHLGHSRCIEVSRLHIKDRSRYDYQKYTATPNTNPTNFWVSFWVTGHYHDIESQGEIIFYDTAGAQILYLQVIRATGLALNYQKQLTYAKDSASAKTTIPQQWNGWLPITVEISTVAQKASIYINNKLIVSNFTLNAGIVGFGAVAFMGGKYVDPAAGNSRWADFDTGAVAVPDGGLLIDGLTWSCADSSLFSHRVFDRSNFMLAYKEHICTHQSTFFNNINGAPGNTLKPLPPVTMPSAQILDYNNPDWIGQYWSFDNQILDPTASVALFSGIVHNWYLWKFPYVFGGKDYVFVSGVTEGRGHLLKHTFDTASSGQLEIIMGVIVSGSNAYVGVDFENKTLAFGSAVSQCNLKFSDSGTAGKALVSFQGVSTGAYIDKGLHKFTVKWSPITGGSYVTILLDDRLLINNQSTTIVFQGIQIADFFPITSGSSTVYAIVWGAQVSTEDTYLKGVLDLVPGGTIEPEAVAGQQISRNGGLFVFNNLTGDWTWENAHFFKTLIPNQANGKILPALIDPQQDMLIELEKGGSAAAKEAIEVFTPYPDDTILPSVNPKWKIINTFAPGTDFFKKKTVTILGSPYEVLQLDKGTSPTPAGFGQISTSYSIISPTVFRDKWFRKISIKAFVEENASRSAEFSIIDVTGNGIVRIKIDGTTFYLRDGIVWRPLFYWPNGYLDYCSMPVVDDIATLPHWAINRGGETNLALSYAKIVSVTPGDSKCRIKHHPPQSWAAYPLVYTEVRNVECRNFSTTYNLDVTFDMPEPSVLPPAAATPLVHQFQVCFSMPNYGLENFYILDKNDQVMVWIQRRFVSSDYRFTVWYGSVPTAWNSSPAVADATFSNFYIKITHGTGANANQVQIEFTKYTYPYGGSGTLGTTPWINLYLDRTWTDPLAKLRLRLPGAGLNRFVWFGQFYHSWKDGNIAGAINDFAEINFIRSSENRFYFQRNTYLGWKDENNFTQKYCTADSYWNTPIGVQLATVGNKQAKAYLVSIDNDDWVYGYSLNQNNQNTIMETGDIGLVNTDLTIYGRYVSLYVNNNLINWKNVNLSVFSTYTFTDGYAEDPFNFEVKGLVGSIPKILAPFAIQLSQINDGLREIFYNFITTNKKGYPIDLALSESITISKQLSPAAKMTIVDLLRNKSIPTKENLISFMSILFGVNENYLIVNERGSDAIVDCSFPIPNNCEIPINWASDIISIINRYKSAGVTYVFYYLVFGVSNNTYSTTTVTFV